MSAKRPVHPTNIHRLKYSIRGQTERRPVRSHKIQFLQWFTGCLIRADLSAKKAGTSDAYAVAEILHSRTSPLPRRPVFDARQRYVEDVVVPPTVFVLLPDSAVSDVKKHFATLCSLRISAACQASIVMRFTHESQRGEQPTLGDIGVVLHR